jgi:hypothetical protein
MKAWHPTPSPTVNCNRRPFRRPRQRSKYIYCHTKHGDRIISRQKPRQQLKFIVCSVSTSDTNPAATPYDARPKDHSYDTIHSTLA